MKKILFSIMLVFSLVTLLVGCDIKNVSMVLETLTKENKTTANISTKNNTTQKESTTISTKEKYGTLENPLTAGEAIGLTLSELASAQFSTEKAYVTGVVASVSYNSKYSSYTAEIKTSETSTSLFKIYSGTVSDGVSSIHIGDIVLAYGYLYNYNGETAEMSGQSSEPIVEFPVYLSATHSVRSITLGEHEHVTVSALPDSKICGETVSFSVEVETGYEIDQVKANKLVLKSEDNNYTFTVAADTIITITTVDEGTKVEKGTIDNPYTPSEAKDIIDGLESGAFSDIKYYVTGKTSSTSYNSKYSSYTTNLLDSDGETYIVVYSANLETGLSEVSDGDTIVAYGYLYLYGGTKYEMAGGSGVDYPIIVKINGSTTQKEEDTTTDPVEVDDKGSIDTPISVKEAKELIDTLESNSYSSYKAYVIGKASDVSFSEKYGSYTLTLTDLNDNALSITLFSADLDSSLTNVAEGDTIVAYGNLILYSGSKYEIAGTKTLGYPVIKSVQGKDVTITYTEVENVTVAELPNTAKVGQSVLFSVKAATGYTIISVKANDKELEHTDDIYELNVLEDTIITIEIAQVKEVSISYKEIENVKVTGLVEKANIGSEISFTVEAVTGYKVTSVTVNDEVILGNNNVYTFILKDETTILVTVEENKDLGTLESPLSVSDIMAEIDKLEEGTYSDVKAYVIGKVTSISYNETYSSYSVTVVDLKESTKIMQFYSATLVKDMTAPHIDDIVVGFGYYTLYVGYSSSTYELSGEKDGSVTYPEIVSITHTERTITTEITNGTINLENSKVLCGATIEFTVTANEGYKVSKVFVNGNLVNCDENSKYSIVVTSDVLIKANILGEDEEEAESLSVTKTIADIATENSWVNEEKYASFAMNDIITVSTVIGSYTGSYYSSNSTWRIYGSEKSTMVITAKDGYVITGIYYERTSGSKTVDFTEYASSKTITDLSAQTLTLSTTGKTFITTLTIYYAKVSE